MTIQSCWNKPQTLQDMTYAPSFPQSQKLFEAVEAITKY